MMDVWSVLHCSIAHWAKSKLSGSNWNLGGFQLLGRHAKGFEKGNECHMSFLVFYLHVLCNIIVAFVR